MREEIESSTDSERDDELKSRKEIESNTRNEGDDELKNNDDKTQEQRSENKKNLRTNFKREVEIKKICGTICIHCKVYEFEKIIYSYTLFKTRGKTFGRI